MLAKIINQITSICPKTILANHFTLSARFSKSLLDEKKYINLSKYDSYFFKIEEGVFDNKTAYNIFFYGTINGTEFKNLIAIFDSKDKAELALYKINNKLYGVVGSILKLIVIVYVSIGVINFFNIVLTHFKQSSINITKQYNKVPEMSPDSLQKQLQELNDLEQKIKQLPKPEEIPQGSMTSSKEQPSQNKSEESRLEITNGTPLGKILLDK